MRVLYDIDTDSGVMNRYTRNKRTFTACHAILGLVAIGCAMSPGHIGTALMLLFGMATAAPCAVLASDLLESTSSRYPVMGEGVRGAITQVAGIGLCALYIALDPATDSQAVFPAVLVIAAAIAATIALSVALMSNGGVSWDKVDWQDMRNKVANQVRASRERRY